jgi:hypothetical protein
MRSAKGNEPDNPSHRLATGVSGALDDFWFGSAAERPQNRRNSRVITGRGTQINAPGDDYYSWRDEILRARAALEPLGGRFAL